MTACGNPPVTIPPAAPDAAIVGPAGAWIDRKADPGLASRMLKVRLKGEREEPGRDG